MAVWIQVLFTILVLFVRENVSDNEESTPTQACSTLDGAKTINEEVAKLFNSVSIHELTKPYFDMYVGIQYENPIDKCYDRRRDRFSERFYLSLASMSNSAKNNEDVLQTAQSLKENITGIVYTYKEAWMKIRKIYKLNEGIFDGLDEYLVDSMMNKTAKRFEEAKKDKNADPNFIQDMIDELSGEFEDANALMRMIPRQILNNPAMLQNNLIYSQVHTALQNTVHKSLLPQNAAIAGNIKVFSEISIKNNIKKATKDLFTTYIKGYEDAKRFSAMTKDTADRLTKAVERADELSVETTCEEGMKIADQLADEGSELLSNVRHEQEDLIGDFYRDLRAWYSFNIKSFEFLDQTRHALTFVSPMVPQNVHPELDELHSYVTSRADKGELKKIVQRLGTYVYKWYLEDGWFEPYDKLSKMLTKLIKVSDCYRKVFQFVGKVVQSCSEGAGSLQDIYKDISSQIPIDGSRCWDVSLFSRPSLDEITGTVAKAARQFGFNKDCEQNTPQQDDAGNARRIVIDDYSDDSEKAKLSRSQRFMICDLRGKYSKSDKEIKKKMALDDVKQVEAVRCKNSKGARRADSMYSKHMQQNNSKE